MKREKGRREIKEGVGGNGLGLGMREGSPKDENRGKESW